jgi:hypothetical protein
MAEIGSDDTQSAIHDAWEDAGQINNVVVIEHDSLSIIQRILEDVATGKELSKGDLGIGGIDRTPSTIETPNRSAKTNNNNYIYVDNLFTKM